MRASGMTINSDSPTAEAFERWVGDRLNTKNLSPSSVPSYERHGRHFTSVVGNKAVKNVSFDDAARWHTSMAALSEATQAGRISVMTKFFDHLVRHEVIDVNPLSRLDKPKVPRTNPRPASQAAIDRTLAANVSPKARMMIRIAQRLALRRFEISRLRRSDFDFDEMVLHLVGKGNKQATLPLPVDLAVEVQAWCDGNYVPPDGWLFPSPRKPGEPLTAKRVGDIMTEASWLAGEHVTPHRIRHRAGTDMNRRHGLKHAQRFLRHSSSATTDIYTEFDVEDLRPAVEDLGGEAA